MQPIMDTANPNITKEPRMVLNPARGNRQVRGRCPRYWGIVLGLSEGAIYARRPPKGIDGRSNDLEGSRGGSMLIEGTSIVIEGSRRSFEGPRRSSEILAGPRRCARDSRDVRTGSDVVGVGCRGYG